MEYAISIIAIQRNLELTVTPFVNSRDFRLSQMFSRTRSSIWPQTLGKIFFQTPQCYDGYGLDNCALLLGMAVGDNASTPC